MYRKQILAKFSAIIVNSKRVVRLAIRDHSFNGYAKISEKLTFLLSDTHTCVRVSGVKKC